MANTGNSTQQSVSTNAGGSSASFRPVVVTPPSQAVERHAGVARALFEGEVDVNDIPDLHRCPLTQEPPVEGVFFMYPTQTGAYVIKYLRDPVSTGGLRQWDCSEPIETSDIPSTDSLFLAHWHGT